MTHTQEYVVPDSMRTDLQFVERKEEFARHILAKKLVDELSRGDLIAARMTRSEWPTETPSVPGSIVQLTVSVESIRVPPEMTARELMRWLLDEMRARTRQRIKNWFGHR